MMMKMTQEPSVLASVDEVILLMVSLNRMKMMMGLIVMSKARVISISKSLVLSPLAHHPSLFVPLAPPSAPPNRLARINLRLSFGL
jgi:hypothetical protein